MTPRAREYYKQLAAFLAGIAFVGSLAIAYLSGVWSRVHAASESPSLPEPPTPDPNAAWDDIPVPPFR